MSGSPYGAGAPTYEHIEVQRSGIEGRLKVARSIRDAAVAEGNQRRAAKWSQIVDELLDRLLEVRGR